MIEVRVELAASSTFLWNCTELKAEPVVAPTTSTKKLRFEIDAPATVTFAPVTDVPPDLPAILPWSERLVPTINSPVNEAFLMIAPPVPNTSPEKVPPSTTALEPLTTTSPENVTFVNSNSSRI